jgi:hypothetical protein
VYPGLLPETSSYKNKKCGLREEHLFRILEAVSKQHANIKGIAMTRLLIARLFKTLMVTTPFFTMIAMVLALWGVGGKTTYVELGGIKQPIALHAGEAKNILVNETKKPEISSTEITEPKITPEVENAPTKVESYPEKIDWEKVI